MTDNEIIVALDGSILNAKRVDCKVWSLEVYKLENALNLINRQKAEIERLEKELMKCKLEKEMLYNVGMEIKTVAIKEFAERFVNEECAYCTVDTDEMVFFKKDIDNLVEEMTEVQE